jgi:SNF family Na+-dependent transporter
MEYLAALFSGFFLPLLAFAALSAVAAIVEYFTANK